MKRVGIIAAVLFVGTVWFANWLVTKYGIVSIGFGLKAPAGVFAVGLALTLRDVVHRALGPAVVIGCIVVGCILAFFIEANTHIPGGHVSLAVGSAIAFLFSELADLTVYTPLEKRSFTGAVLASNVVGLFADSLLFLILVFGSLTFFWGQVVGKAWMTLAALPIIYLTRRFWPTPEPAIA